MRYSIKIPLFLICYFVLTAVYTLVHIDSEWMDVFWASYKNVTLIGCLYFMTVPLRILWTDKIFIRGAIIINIIQSLMYPLCPISTDAQKIFYFNMYGWFVILIGIVCIILYFKELLGGNGN